MTNPPVACTLTPDALRDRRQGLLSDLVRGAEHELLADGLRLRFADGAWLGLRRSNTEPIVRLVVESPDAQWVSHVVSMLRKV